MEHRDDKADLYDELQRAAARINMLRQPSDCVQTQERNERLTAENLSMRSELAKLKVELATTTRELHSYAYMLTKAQLAVRVADCELALVTDEYEKLKQYIRDEKAIQAAAE